MHVMGFVFWLGEIRVLGESSLPLVRYYQTLIYTVRPIDVQTILALLVTVNYLPKKSESSGIKIFHVQGQVLSCFSSVLVTDRPWMCEYQLMTLSQVTHRNLRKASIGALPNDWRQILRSASSLACLLAFWASLFWKHREQMNIFFLLTKVHGQGFFFWNSQQILTILYHERMCLYKANSNTCIYYYN